MTTALDPIIHERLMLEIDKFAADAQIPRSFIEQSCASYCTSDQLLWLTHFKKQSDEGRNGLILLGQGDPTFQMYGMCGALLRNFVRARTITMSTITDDQFDADLLDITCLFIPNFYNHEAGSDSIPGWKMPSVYDFLMRRAAKGKQTVVHVSDAKRMKSTYGAAIANHLLATYEAVSLVEEE